MRAVFFLLLINILNRGHAQDQFTGIWYSSDSTRLYHLFEENKKYCAVIYSSQRKADRRGTLILSDISFRKSNRKYYGVIHSLKDGSKRIVKLYLADRGNELVIEIPRMWFFPVMLYWRRKDE
jgi:hypothetical protein